MKRQKRQINIECEHCGQTFIAYRKTAKYCPECKRIRRTHLMKSYRKQGRITDQNNIGTGNLTSKPDTTDWKRELRLIRAEKNRLYNNSNMYNEYVNPDPYNTISGFIYTLEEVEQCIDINEP